MVWVLTTIEADMEAKPADSDLSMEEILQSIRKIIAEDGEEVKPAMTAATSAPAQAAKIQTEPTEVVGSDVLELTDIVAEPANGAHNDILSTIDHALAPAPEPQSMAKPTAPAPTAALNQTYIDSLLSRETVSATSAAFKKLEKPEAPLQLTPFPGFQSGATLEQIVTEMLRPMLKQWLDANLTSIVERVVEREVRKLSH
jgi:cell pole-organizing protein PopZ